jgi:hypothetical protein
MITEVLKKLIEKQPLSKLEEQENLRAIKKA